MPDSQKLTLRPPNPTKDDPSSDQFVCHEEDWTGARLCSICRKVPAEVGGLCVGCDHLMDDIRFDRVVGLI